MMPNPLPGSERAERSILGAILLNNFAYNQAAESLKPEDFSLDSHRRIYSRIVDLAKSSRPIDLITLIEELDRHKDLQAVGDVPYVSSLLEGVPDQPSIEHYVKIVRDKALLRSLIRFAEDVTQRSSEGSQPVEEIIAVVEVGIRGLVENYSLPARSTHIRTWQEIPTLDKLPVADVSWTVQGVIPAGSIVLWAGESGSYKTWLSLWLAKTVNEGQDFLGRKTVRTPVLYLDRENPLPLIQERCSLLGVRPSSDLRFWGGWQSDPPPMIGDRRLLEIARTIKPLIILDSFIRFHSADENSATQMGQVMAELRKLANTGATLVLQHHKPKAEGTQYRGSSDIKAGVDVGYAVSHNTERKFVTIQCFKNRFGEETTVTVGPQVETDRPFEVTEDRGLLLEREIERALRRIIQAQPGISESQILKFPGFPHHKTRSTLERGVGQAWRTNEGPRGRLSYYPIGSDSSSSVLQGCSTEKLKSSDEYLQGDVSEGESHP